MSLFGSFRGLSIINSFIIHKLFSRVTSLKIISGEPRKQVDLILLAVYLLCDQTTKSWFYNEAFTNNINNAGLIIVVNLPSRLWCGTNYCELTVYVQSRISQYFTKKFPVQVGANEVIACYLFTFVLVKHVQIILDALRDLSQFSQSKKRERHPWRSFF